MKHETAENEILLSLPLTMRPKVLELAIWYLLLLSTRVQSFGSRLLNLFRPSSTEHLADLLELYDLVQDPSFLSKQRKLAFQSLLADVEVSSDGVVEGQGLIAKRDFSAGEVVAFYPIHALGYSNGKSPPRVHLRSGRAYSWASAKSTRIIGTSDLVYFEDESHAFGDDQEDFSYTMTDPSGKYYFDVNPKRNNNLLNPNDLLFKAHYVNDAFFADFTPIVTAAKDLRRNDVDFKAQSQELDNAAAELAIEYLESSCDSFNVVMCGFGPPPLMAYVATRPVQRGQELLASYGLGYWLGKAFADDDERVLDAALAALEEKSEVRKAQSQADRIIETALGAGDRAIQSDFQVHTTLIKGMFRALRKEKRKRSRNN